LIVHFVRCDYVMWLTQAAYFGKLWET